MQTTADFLDALRVKLDLESDGALARYLGMRRQHVSKYRTGLHTFDDSMCLRIALILQEPPGYMLACMQYQRAKLPPLKDAWLRVAELSRITAALLFFVLIFLPPLSGSDSSKAVEMSPAYSDSLYIMSNAHSYPFALFMLLFILTFPPLRRAEIS